jgi:hypothetical protein
MRIDLLDTASGGFGVCTEWRVGIFSTQRRKAAKTQKKGKKKREKKAMGMN